MPKVRFLTRDFGRVSPRDAWFRKPEWDAPSQYWSFADGLEVTRSDCLRILGRDLKPGECVRLKEPLDCPATPEIWHNYPRPPRE